MDRREFVGRSSLAAFAGLSAPLSRNSFGILEQALLATNKGAESLATDDEFWLEIRKAFVTSPDLIDFDNANTGPTPQPVFSSYTARGQSLRQAPSERFDKMWDQLDTVVRPDLATFLGAKREEVAFTPNATYGLNTVLHGFPLERGDEIIVTNHEYPDMIETVLQRQKREGIVMRVIDVPDPDGNRLALIDRLEKAITPRTKLLLISHVSAWSGEILPVRELVAAARRHNVATLVDAAQSVGTLHVNFRDIDADFVATSLHKGLGAPMGTGALLMKTAHIGKVWPLNPPSWDTTKHPMDLYEWCGTFHMSGYLSTQDALRFQRRLGLERKQARIRFLGDYWQSRVSNLSRVKILTPKHRSRSFGVASIMIDGIPSEKVAKALREKGIIVQDKSGRHSPFKNAVRVSPGIYATTRELDRFIAAIKALGS
ncbi:MAG TPA: aminotransferase class V-fold PLP-dependent enzyme [Gemmatimonadaceae bacterium]